MREIYVRAAKEFRLEKGKILWLLKPLYGLPDGGDYWDATILRHIEEDLHMSRSALDICLFFRKLRGELHGLSGMYVDDSLHARTPEFLEFTRQSERKFKSKPQEFDSFKFADVQIDTTYNGILIHQSEYIGRLKPLPQEASFRNFRSLPQRLQWLTHTRPDISCAVMKCTQVTESLFSPDAINKINSIVQQARISRHF